MRRAFILLLLLASMITVAHAQDAAPQDEPAEEEETPQMREAMERFEGAQALFDAGDYSGALAEFQRIYDLLMGHPNRYFVLFNIGRAYEELNRYDRAIEFYQRYLDEGGEAADDRAEVEASLRVLERRLGTVAITVNVPHAEVWLGDRQIGEAPGEVRIPGGDHTLEVRAQGFEPARREITVASRQRVEIALELAQLNDFRGINPGVFVATAVAAVVVAAVGAGLSGYAFTLSQDATACGTTRGCMLDTEARRAQIRELALVADVMYGTAGVLAVAAVVLAVLTDWRGAEAEVAPAATAQVVPFASPTEAGLLLHLEL